MTIRVITPQGMASEAIERRLREMEADILRVLGLEVTCILASEPFVPPMTHDGVEWLMQTRQRPPYADSETSSDEDWDMAVKATIREARARHRRRAQR